MTPLVVYIAGPYRASTPFLVEQNIRRAEAMMLLVVGMGLVPLCPHTMTRFIDGTGTDEYWLNTTLELMRRCDAVLLCEDWQHSSGTLGELAEARALGMPIYENLHELAAAVAAATTTTKD